MRNRNLRKVINPRITSKKKRNLKARSPRRRKNDDMLSFCGLLVTND